MADSIAVTKNNSTDLSLFVPWRIIHQTERLTKVYVKGVDSIR